MALCRACTAIRISALTAEVDDPPSWLPPPSGGSSVTGMRHLSDARQLPASALSCSFCALIEAAILQNYCTDELTAARPSSGDAPPRWDEAGLRERLADAPIYLQLRRNGVGRIPRERPSAPLEWLGKAIAVFLPVADGADGVLRGRIRLYAHPDSPAYASGDVLCGPPLPSSNCPEAFRMTREWLATCLKFHPGCSKTLSRSEVDETSDPVLPTRVIDVAPFEHSPKVRLVEGKGRHARYVTLSHCWGPRDRHPLTTTTATLPQHLSVIAWDQLPKTFQDAITVVRELGIRYIWIDSLCIVQDDRDDWLRESEQMGIVYERAALTIAACHAANSTEGCFFERPPPRPAVKLPYWDAQGQQDGEFFATLLPRAYESISPEFSPLSERAWATQEWLLSRRVLFYTKECIVWSCRTVTQRETRDSFHDTARNTRWKIIVEKYSGRKLTNATDRLVALKGLINEMQKRNQTRCIQGIWADTLADQLLWFSLEPAERHLNPLHLPTWTWASTCHGVRFQKIDRGKRLCRKLRIKDDDVVEAVGAVKKLPSLRALPDIAPLSRQNSGLGPEGHVHAHSDPRMVEILESIEGNLHGRISTLSFDLTEQPFGWRLTYIIYDLHDSPLGWASLDEGEPPDEDIFCLAVLGRNSSEPPGAKPEADQRWVLLLVRRGVNEECEVYQRVGVGFVNSKSWYDDAETKRIRIV